jgi:hypothetical protein
MIESNSLVIPFLDFRKHAGLAFGLLVLCIEWNAHFVEALATEDSIIFSFSRIYTIIIRFIRLKLIE